MAGLAILVKPQVICALARILPGAMVKTLPARVPKAVAGLPEAAELASVQEADTMVKFAATVSVIATAVPTAVTGMGATTVG